MLFKVLDEVCQHESHGLWHAQQAFVTGRDIIRNTTMLCRNFWAAHEEAAEGDDPYLLLALDCSKGYNHKFDMALSVFGRVKTSLSLAMRVFVVNIFKFTLFSYPNRHFSCRVCCCKRSSVKFCVS